MPHDYNRDYSFNKEAVYASVREIRKMADTGRIIIGFDFHSSWNFGGENDYQFIVQKDKLKVDEMKRFARILEKNISPCSLKYSSMHDIPPDCGGNDSKSPAFSNYLSKVKGMELADLNSTAYKNREHDSGERGYNF